MTKLISLKIHIIFTKWTEKTEPNIHNQICTNSQTGKVTGPTWPYLLFMTYFK